MKTVLVAAIFGLVASPLASDAGAVAEALVVENAYVYITGAVPKPGKYLLTEKMTALTLIQQAGGLTPFAVDRILVISGTEKDQRGLPLVKTVSFKEMVAATPERPALLLSSGDQVLVGGS